MSKLTKLLRRPRRYFADARLNRHWEGAQTRLGKNAPTAVLVGFASWKTFILDFLPDHNVIVLSRTAKLRTQAILQIGTFNNPTVYSWSYRYPPDLNFYCRRHGVPLVHVEDGFIRSKNLGADRTSPFSLVFDDLAMHFDRLRPSRLENLLADYDFAGDTALMAAAAELARLIVTMGLTKYNLGSRTPIAPYLHSGRRKVLVLGQVEDDLSIKHGADRIISGNEMVALAAKENPSAQILYRPHPEAISYAKPHYSNPELVADMCTILGPETRLADCLDASDLVYTVTSLAGFEAALRGKPVVTLGTPFYAGWGFTQDRLPVPRRARTLTPIEVLAAAYLLYPRYSGVAETGPDRYAQILDGARAIVSGNAA